MITSSVVEVVGKIAVTTEAFAILLDVSGAFDNVWQDSLVAVSHGKLCSYDTW